MSTRASRSALNWSEIMLASAQAQERWQSLRRCAELVALGNYLLYDKASPEVAALVPSLLPRRRRLSFLSSSLGRHLFRAACQVLVNLSIDEMRLAFDVNGLRESRL